MRVDCRGELVPGLARWQVRGTAVLLDLDEGETDARDLVRSWPPSDQAPWLGHALVGATVLTPRRIRVEFRRPWPPPVRLFADPRLGPGHGDADDPDADARDLIDTGAEGVRTRHERSVDYGRSIGRSVIREGFDRRYYVVLALSGSLAEARDLEEALRQAWVVGGVSGSRRLPGEEAVEGGECAPVAGASRVRSRPDAGTVSFPVRDPVAREIAERLVSASLPGGAAEWIAPGGLRIRGYGAEPGGPAGDSDVARVVSVPIGPVHPCSIWGELRRVESRFGAGRDGGVRSLAIGETALFRIEAEGVGG